MSTISGHFTGFSSSRVAIVVSRFNSTITDQLLKGALDTLLRHGVQEKSITTVWVPGAFEIPLAVQSLVDKAIFDGVIALGAVIRGSTPHFDYVCSETAKGISNVALSNKVPVAFGVLTTDTLDQAFERSGTKSGNKGVDAAQAVLEMIDVVKQIKKLK